MNINHLIANKLIAEHRGKPRGDEVAYSCLDHDDQHASASYNTAKNTWYCQRCDKGGGGIALAQRLGIPTNGHKPTDNDPQRRTVTIYPFYNTAGNIVSRTVRTDPKGFYQQRPDGKGGWINNLDGVNLIPYRLPELVKAPPTEIRIIVEGEKDVDQLRLQGFIATTNPMGAGKWRPAYNHHFKGHDIVIIPDNDDAGRAHAEAIKRSLEGTAKTVRIIELDGLPEKGDVSDWFAMGHKPEELRERIKLPETQPIWMQNMWTHERLMAQKFPEKEWVVEGLIPDRGLTFLGAKKKIGKSWLCLQIVQAVASGTKVLGRKTKEGRVVYLCLEDGNERVQARLAQQQAPKNGLEIAYFARWRPLDGEGMADLEELLTALKPRLLIIDTLAAVKTGKTDENAAGVMADLGNALRSMAQDHGVAIIVVVHHGKHISGDPGEDIRGSSAVGAAGDVNLGIYKDDNRFTLKGEGRDIEGFELRVELDMAYTWSWQLVGDARQIAREEAENEVIDALAALGEADATKIAREAGKSRVQVQIALKRLRVTGDVLYRPDKSDKAGKILYRLPNKEGNPLHPLPTLHAQQHLHILQDDRF